MSYEDDLAVECILLESGRKGSGPQTSGSDAPKRRSGPRGPRL